MVKLPRRVVVADVVSSRYPAGTRPTSWDARRPGLDKIKTESGEHIELFSSGGQSTPKAGWELLLMEQHSQSGVHGVTWTLYGIKPSH